ncbi:hypothetical protein [Sphaerospermopsis torques-reginae]|uniref:Uncharacterized protein n=1 Tax=Sphaerospermopsis torques-reginae ITEP-024 TaxID=984208 RepID=A0ABX8WUJ9_9CYAN|nr:hypothetical protein [Sphaerospermopsis torques-reginae]QYX30067.1 hypothetical protein K2F26_13955 [Sphaerospermopsis torques-reginae ITEP-024]
MTEIEILIGFIGIELALASFLYKIFKDFQIQVQEEIDSKTKTNFLALESIIKPTFRTSKCSTYTSIISSIEC